MPFIADIATLLRNEFTGLFHGNIASKTTTNNNNCIAISVAVVVVNNNDHCCCANTNESQILFMFIHDVFFSFLHRSTSLNSCHCPTDKRRMGKFWMWEESITLSTYSNRTYRTYSRLWSLWAFRAASISLHYVIKGREWFKQRNVREYLSSRDYCDLSDAN